MRKVFLSMVIVLVVLLTGTGLACAAPSINDGPQFYGPEKITVPKGTQVDFNSSMFRVQAMDLKDGNLTHEIITKSNNVDSSKSGTYKAEFSVTDSDKKTATRTVTVEVKENISNITVEQTFYVLPSYNYFKGKTLLRGIGMDRQHIGIYMPKGSEVTVKNIGKAELEINLFDATNDESRGRAKLPAGESRKLTDATEARIPLVHTTCGNGNKAALQLTYSIAPGNQKAVKPLTYYLHGDDQDAFLREFSENKPEAAIIESDRITLLVPYGDLSQLQKKNPTLEKLFDYYEQIFTLWDQMEGLSFTPENPKDQNYRYKYFVKPGTLTGAGAYYRGYNWVGQCNKNNGKASVNEFLKLNRWLALHELAHGYDKESHFMTKNHYILDVWNNIYAYEYLVSQGADPAETWASRSQSKMERRESSKDTKKFNSQSLANKLNILLSMVERDPVKAMAALNRGYRSQSNQQTYKNSEYMALYWGQGQKINLLPYMNDWGLSVSDSVRNTINKERHSLAYPLADLVEDEDKALQIKNSLGLDTTYSLVTPGDLSQNEIKGNVTVTLTDNDFNKLKGKTVGLYDGKQLVVSQNVEKTTLEFKDVPIGVYYLATSGGELCANPSYVVVEQHRIVESIRIAKTPKSNFLKGDSLQAGSGQIEITYTDGSKKRNVPLQTGWIKGYDKNTIGTQTLTVNYEGKTATYQIIVKDAIWKEYCQEPQYVATSQNNGTTVDTKKILLKNTGGNSYTKVGLTQFALTDQMKYAIRNGAKATLKYKAECNTVAQNKACYIEFRGLESEIKSADWAKTTYNKIPKRVNIAMSGYDTLCKYLSKANNQIGAKGQSFSGSGDVTSYVKTKLSGDTVTFYFNIKNSDAKLIEEMKELELVISGKVPVAELDGVSVTKMPTNKIYVEGQKFKKDGMQITAIYSDGTKKEIKNYTVNPEGPLTVDTKTVTVIYTENGVTKTKTVDIEVKPRAVDRTEITPPNKTLYVAGQNLDLSGCRMTLMYNDDTTETIDVTPDMVSGYEKDVPGKQILTVTHDVWSDTFEVEVEPKAVIDILIQGEKLSYIEGQRFNIDCMKVLAQYNDGDEKEVEGYTVSPEGPLTVDTKTVTISYTENGVTKTKDVSIEVVPRIVESMQITPPNKTLYVVGQNLELSGCCMTLTYNDDTTETIDVTPDMVSGYEKDVAGKQIITVTHDVWSDTFEVEVEPKTVIGILIQGEKLSYIEGQSFNIDCMKVMAQYNDGDEKEVEGYTVSPEGPLTVDTKTVTISYTENGVTKTKDVSIEVVPRIVESMQITPPNKTLYVVGQNLELSGCCMTLTYNDDTTETVDVTLDMVSGYKRNKAGTQKLKVTFEGHEAIFSVILSSIKVSPQRLATLRNDGSKAATGSIHLKHNGSGKNTRIGMAQFSMTEEMKQALQKGAKATLKYTAVCEKTAAKSYNYIQFYGTKTEVSEGDWGQMTYSSVPAVTAIKFNGKATACRYFDRDKYLSTVGSKYSGAIDATEYVKSKVLGDTVTFRFNLSDQDAYLMESIKDLQLVIE